MKLHEIGRAASSMQLFGTQATGELVSMEVSPFQLPRQKRSVVELVCGVLWARPANDTHHIVLAMPN